MPKRPRRDARVINSLARGVEILRFLTDSAGPVGVTDVAERLRVDPSTAYRLLVTLEAGGMVRQDPDTKKYGLGYGVLEVAHGLLGRLSVASVAEPHLLEIATATGESAHVAVLDGMRAVFVGRHSGAGILRVETTIGSSEPAYCTAVGKALLADHTLAELRRLLGEHALERHTPQTITSVVELANELERIRRTGYAYDDEEMHPGVRCLACSVRDHRGRIVAAFGISMPASRLTREHLPALVRRIAEASAAISAELGYQARGRATRSS
jgi:IclR family transcriptional regulator, KDG regulon repressor